MKHKSEILNIMDLMRQDRTEPLDLNRLVRKESLFKATYVENLELVEDQKIIVSKEQDPNVITIKHFTEEETGADNNRTKQ